MFSTGLIWGVSWFWYLAGLLGFGGAAAALYLVGPAVVVPVIQGAFRFLIGTRVGVGLLAGCVAFMVADIRRSRMDTADFAQRTAAFEQAQKDREVRIERDTRELVWKEIADATAQSKIIDTEVKAFNDAPPPPAPANDPYDIAPADRLRLCRIAGKTDCGSRGARRMQAPWRPASHSGNRKLPKAGAGGAR